MGVVVKMAPGGDPAQHARDGGLSHACPPGDLSWGERPAGVDQGVQPELVAGQPHWPQGVIEQAGGEVAHQPDVEQEGGVTPGITVTLHMYYDTAVLSIKRRRSPMQWSGITEGIADTVLRHRFEPAAGHALDGIIASPVAEDLAFADVSVWDGHSGRRQPGRCVVIRDGLISEVVEASRPLPTGIKVISASGKTLIPGLIDAHVHLMFDSGPDLLTRAPQLRREWLHLTRKYPESRDPIVRRAQLKLKSGVTTMRVLGDGYYSLALRDD